MNQLFEGYIGIIARRVFSAQGLKVSLQGPRQHLARYENGNPVFELRPDIVASDAGNIKFIIDTKWKRLKEAGNREGVATSDVYQMYAYSTRYASPDVTLLYPHHAELGIWEPKRAEYWLKGASESGDQLTQRISVATVDLRDLNSVSKQLEKIFPVSGQTLAGSLGPMGVASH